MINSGKTVIWKSLCRIGDYGDEPFGRKCCEYREDILYSRLATSEGVQKIASTALEKGFSVRIYIDSDSIAFRLSIPSGNEPAKIVLGKVALSKMIGKTYDEALTDILKTKEVPREETMGAWTKFLRFFRGIFSRSDKTKNG